MKNIYMICVLSILVLFSTSYAQDLKPDGDPVSLGSLTGLVNQINTKVNASNGREVKTHLALKVGAAKTFDATVNFNKTDAASSYVVGEIEGQKGSSFYLDINNGSVRGNIILKNKRQAYEYYSDEQGNAYVKEVDINKLLCVDYDQLPEKEKTPSSLKQAAVAAANNLQSLPGAPGCVLLDFDGEYVVGTPWNGGVGINAAPAGMSDAAITEAWELVSEDFRPFRLNVTTDANVFNSYPKNRRMRCIFTPTKTVAPTAGGVAYIGSFSWNDDTPCWVFILSGKSGGEAASHEIGHTFDLRHDGRTNPVEGYYQGHGNWAPIMGVGYYRPISQWSKGEFANADNTQDDLAVIAGTKFGVGYRNDDHGNTISTAKALVVTSTGSVVAANNTGVIERTSDLDFFSFNTSGGNISLNVNTVSRHGDLDVLVRLYTQSGTEIGVFNQDGLNATVTASLGAGTYYISVDGTGFGNPLNTGYSDYASLGSYTISGTIPNATVSLRNPENPAGTVAGLDYKYYEGNWNALPNFASLTAVKSGTVTTVGLSPRNRDDQFGFSFTGYINVPTDGSYTFYTSSDDGSRLYIGTTLVVDNDGLHGNQERSGTIGLKAGKHAMTITFFEQGGDQVLTASYSGPGISKQTIPASALFRVPVVVTRATVYQHCDYSTAGYGINLAAGTYTTAQMQALGILNNDISSLKVTSGYEIVLYDLDNFQGASQIFRSDVSCLVSHGINDWASSIVVRTITVSPNQPPTVSITSPSNNASFTAPASITINANASDADGTISKVEFYNGTTLLNTDTSSPYSFAWTNVEAGSYSITARATDNSGAVTTSTVVNVVVTSPTNQLPTVTITSPAHNASFNAPANITITANASDADGSISKVDFYIGSTLLFSDATAPYGVVWANATAGTYSLTARATDNSGGVRTSSAVTVIVKNVTTDACASIAQYVENGGYVAGSIVKNSGNRYECKPWPYSGWCNGAAWAYGAGTGMYWQDAWILLGSCQAQASNVDLTSSSAQVNENVLSNAPNPFVGSTTVDVVVAEAGPVSVKVYDKTGQVVAVLVDDYLSSGSHRFVLEGASLPSDVYIVRYESNSQVITRKVVKGQ